MSRYQGVSKKWPLFLDEDLAWALRLLSHTEGPVVDIVAADILLHLDTGR